MIVDKIVKLLTFNKIDANDVEKMFYRINPNIGIICTDEWYQLRSKKDVKKFLEKDDTDKMEYVATILDCDDFSVNLLGKFSVPGWSGACIGILMIGYHNKEGGHAINVFIDKEKKIYVIEPQNDSIHEFHTYMKDNDAYPYLVLFI